MSHPTGSNISTPSNLSGPNRTGPRRTAPRRPILPLAACAVLLVAFAATAWLASLHESATTDEPGSLLSAWACTHLLDFRCDQENPPLWKYYVGIGTRYDDLKVPLDSPRWRQMVWNTGLVGPFASDVLYRTPGNDADTLLRRGRARIVVLGVILGALIGWWAWRLAGPVAGIVAMAFFCLDPNFLAHAPLVKNDVALTLTLLWLTAIVWLIGERATLPRLLFLPLALASVLMVKFSGLIAIPILGAALLLRSFLPIAWPIGPWNAATRLRRLAAASAMFLASLLLTWGLIWACYGFRYAPTNDPGEYFDFPHSLETCAAHEYIARSDDPFNVSPQAVRDFVANWKPPASVRTLLAANAHRLLPQSCLGGLLNTYAWTRGRMAYLCGNFSLVGWWYYFPLAMAFKTPLATLSALAIALILFAVQKPRLNSAAVWALAAAAITPILYMACAMSSRVDVGIRHIFPVYPFLFILLGVTAARACKRYGKPAVVVMAVLLLGVAVETYRAFPDYIPFFNVAAGGARNGLRLLSDSNLDWGQDLPQLAQWQRQHPDHQLYLCYWGSADPRYYGVRYVNLAGSSAPADQLVPSRQTPVYAISAMALINPGFRQVYKTLLDALESQRPITVLDGSIYVFAAPR
ncbi:MAG TPA: hypothetical protein VHX86_04710 [Tepidisphaeraceae bacterium]|jgi:hypothetical protein|nr:hypothetical protein [Tepidisphaeraceae bacterium]